MPPKRKCLSGYAKRLKKKKDAELVNSLRGSLDRFITRETEGLGGHLVNEEAEEHTVLNDNDMKAACIHLETVLRHGESSDVDGEDLFRELKLIREILPKQKMTASDILNFLQERNTCPVVRLAYRILLTVPVTVASAERSFSKLKLLKSYLRSTMSQERLNGLALISIENEYLGKINCDKLIDQFAETFNLMVDYGKTYLLRLINSVAQEIMFFSIANHKVTVVGADASYTKPFTTDYVTISPGQTLDLLLTANQKPNHYYMAAKAYVGGVGVPYDNTTTTALLQYSNRGLKNYTYTPSPTPSFPTLPAYNDTNASVNFSGSLRSLADKNHPIDVPLKITTHLFYTLSVNSFPCPNNSCAGPNGTRFAASVNNISFVDPSIDILQAYYYHVNGEFGTRFPDFPPSLFNFTAQDLPLYLQTPKRGTEVKVLEYNTTVELVFQGTNLVSGDDHPMHLHGYSFYVVGMGLGNFDKDKDPSKYNLVDPPLRNTVIVPVNGWTTIRFKANNPGVWFMHCHLDRHMSWGMDVTFIVKNGKGPQAQMLPPPPDMPPC